MPLDRDVIFVAEAGEEAKTSVGIDYLVKQHWNDIDAEYCLAESGQVNRKNGQVRMAFTSTSEKRPMRARLVAHGPAGHGSRPMQSNAVVHLAQAVAKIAAWDPPMRLNDTTRAYFEKLATVELARGSGALPGSAGPGEGAGGSRVSGGQRSGALFHAAHLDFAHHAEGRIAGQRDPLGGRSHARHSRAAGRGHGPISRADEAGDQRSGSRDRAECGRTGVLPRRLRRWAPPRIMAIEAAYRKVYNVATAPMLQTGATDMAFLRAKGEACYGVGPMLDEEDAPKGFGAHSDQERLLEEAIYKHVQFFWEAVTGLAAKK